MTNKTRVRWIDSARGLAIVLVVLGHALSGRGICEWIYYFHVPLFVVISGCCFKKRNLKEQLIVSIRREYIPYLCFGFIGIILFLGLGLYNPSLLNGKTLEGAFLYHLKGLLYGSGSLDRTPEYGGALYFNTPIWYIPFSISLKLAVTIIYSLVKDTRKHNILLMGGTTVSALSLIHI